VADTALDNIFFTGRRKLPWGVRVSIFLSLQVSDLVIRDVVNSFADQLTK
jgi:hypothetical protein